MTSKAQCYSAILLFGLPAQWLAMNSTIKAMNFSRDMSTLEHPSLLLILPQHWSGSLVLPVDPASLSLCSAQSLYGMGKYVLGPGGVVSELSWTLASIFLLCACHWVQMHLYNITLGLLYNTGVLEQYIKLPLIRSVCLFILFVCFFLQDAHCKWRSKHAAAGMFSILESFFILIHRERESIFSWLNLNNIDIDCTYIWQYAQSAWQHSFAHASMYRNT